MAPRRILTDSPFDTLEKTFDLLVTGPNPLALDGATVAGLPDRAIPLGELKARLLHPSTPFDVRDAVVNELVARSRAQGGAWTVGLAGVLLPGLRRAAWPLVQACPGKAADIEAETLAAFLAAVADCKPGRARLASRLCWLARIGANRLLARRAGRACPARHRTGLRGPAPAVGAPRPRARQSGAGRGDQRGGRRADRRHPHRRRRPGRRRQRTRARLQGLPPTAPSG